jgi:hypothetical protein
VVPDSRPLAILAGALAVVLAGVVLLRLAVHPVGRLVVVGLAVGVAAGLAWTLTRPAAYDRTRIGTGTRVLTRPATPSDGPCVECDADGPALDAGERRQYVREAVVAGVPLVVLDRGENVYCAGCAAADRGADDAPVDPTARAVDASGEDETDAESDLAAGGR